MMKVAFRLDGNKHIGLGHVFRSLHLADHLKAARGAECRFFMLESSLSETVRHFLDASGHGWRAVSTQDDPWREDADRLLAEVREFAPDVAVSDILEPDENDSDLLDNPEYVPVDPVRTLAALKRAGVPRVAISDRFDRVDLDAELIIDTCPAQDPAWYAGEDRRYLLGAAGYVLAPSLMELAGTPPTFDRDRLRLVVFCGGNDHRGFSEVIFSDLANRLDRVDVEIIIGAATPDGERVAGAFRERGVKAHFKVPDVAAIFAGAQLAVSTSGNTLFDLAALGIPFAALSTRDRQLLTAEYFEREGCGFSLGLYSGDYLSALSRVLDAVLPDRERLETMSRRGRRVVDGRGAERIAAELERLAR